MAKLGVAAALIANVCVFETAAAPVVVTPTLAEPGVAISAAGIAAINCAELTKVVVLGAPFHVTVEDPETKPAPFTVKVKAVPPAVADDGESEDVDGTGMFFRVML